MICRLLGEWDALHASRYRKQASRKCRAPRDCEKVHANLLSISCRQLRVNVNRARCSLAHRGRNYIPAVDDEFSDVRDDRGCADTVHCPQLQRSI